MEGVRVEVKKVLHVPATLTEPVLTVLHVPETFTYKFVRVLHVPADLTCPVIL
jgi:chemotaxis response regulator CheB